MKNPEIKNLPVSKYTNPYDIIAEHGLGYFGLRETRLIGVRKLDKNKLTKINIPEHTMICVVEDKNSDKSGLGEKGFIRITIENQPSMYVFFDDIFDKIASEENKAKALRPATRNWTTINSLQSLSRGNIIRKIGGDRAFVVDANYGSYITIVNTADISNPIEWLVFSQHSWVNIQSVSELNEGDIIKGKSSIIEYIVTHEDRYNATACHTDKIKDIAGWEIYADNTAQQELLDCIHNLMALVDTPVGRMQVKGSIADEARQIGREILKSNGRSIYG